jgi:Helix-turn-helix domain
MTFRYRIDLSPGAERVLARHAGASRFGFNQCLRLHLQARGRRGEMVPWSGFDLINAFTSWKRSQQAGRRFTVASDGQAELVATGLHWRDEAGPPARLQAGMAWRRVETCRPAAAVIQDLLGMRHHPPQLDLSESTYRCPEPDCGAALDRDLNAAINLGAWAENGS